MNNLPTKAVLLSRWQPGVGGSESLLINRDYPLHLCHSRRVDPDLTEAEAAADQIRVRSAVLRGISSCFGTDDQVHEAIAAIEQDPTRDPELLVEQGWELRRGGDTFDDSLDLDPWGGYSVCRGRLMLFLRKDSPSGVGFGWVEEFADCLPAKYSGEILEEIREVLARTDQAHLLADPVFLPDTFGFTHRQ